MSEQMLKKIFTIIYLTYWFRYDIEIKNMNKNNKLIFDENNPDVSSQVCRTDRTGDRTIKGITNRRYCNES